MFSVWFLQNRRGRNNTLKVVNHRLLKRILKRATLATLPKISTDFNAETSTSAGLQTLQQAAIDMGFRYRMLNRCWWLYGIKLHVSPGVAYTSFGLLIARDTFIGLICLLSSLIGWMVLYKYLDILMKSWNIHTNRGGGGGLQTNGDSVILCNMYTVRDMGSLIHLVKTLTCEVCVRILTHYIHPFMCIVNSNGYGQFK